MFLKEEQGAGSDYLLLQSSIFLSYLTYLLISVIKSTALALSGAGVTTRDSSYYANRFGPADSRPHAIIAVLKREKQALPPKPQIAFKPIYSKELRAFVLWHI